MAASSLCVVKIGGSLVADPTRLKRLLGRLADGAEGPVAIVPGGGPFADAVRSAQGALGFDDGLAHRLAIDAMCHMAEVFCAIERRLSLASQAAVVEALAGRQAVVWTAADLRDGHPSIPESWEVTSDSLAIWLAARLNAARCILVKSAPCPAETEVAELVRHGVVDRAFPGFARTFGGDIVIRSPDGERVLNPSAKQRSSHPDPHPEVRGEAEPRRSPPASTAIPGGLLRGGSAAPQDEGLGGIGGPSISSLGDAA